MRFLYNKEKLDEDLCLRGGLWEYTRLDRGEDLPETTMMDRRGDAAHYAVELQWADLFSRRARKSKSAGEVAHINVLEAQALLS